MIRLILLFTFISFQINAQIIPKEWEGRWEGSVKTWSFNNQLDSFGMSIEILPKDSVWDFTLSYDREYKGKADIRNYQLIVEEKSKYHLSIDEKNGIFLDSYRYGDCLYNRFSGMGSDLQVRMCIKQGEMDYEITSYGSEAVRTSGDELIFEDTIPKIESYELNFLMKGQLIKTQD